MMKRFNPKIPRTRSDWRELVALLIVVSIIVGFVN